MLCTIQQFAIHFDNNAIEKQERWQNKVGWITSNACLTLHCQLGQGCQHLASCLEPQLLLLAPLALQEGGEHRTAQGLQR